MERTIVSLLREAQERLEIERGEAQAQGFAEAPRELSLAITDIQTAIMWTQRAMARKHGMFNEIDVEAIALGGPDNRIVKT